jgi:hypothetical protein
MADDPADLAEETPQKVPLATVRIQEAPERAPDPPASTAKQETSDAVATSEQQTQPKADSDPPTSTANQETTDVVAPSEQQTQPKVEETQKQAPARLKSILKKGPSRGYDGGADTDAIKPVPKKGYSASTDPLEEHEPGFIIIKIPLQPSVVVEKGVLPRRSVNAHYASVDMVRRMTKEHDPGNERKLEWARAASCDPQGNVLKHVAQASSFPGCSCSRLVRDAQDLFRFIARKRTLLNLPKGPSRWSKFLDNLGSLNPLVLATLLSLC